MSRSFRRHRVVTRPKVRGRRVRQAAVGGALLCLAAVAAMTVRQLKAEAPSWAALKSRLAPAARAVEVSGAPDVLRAPLRQFLQERLPAVPEPAEVLQAFPCLASARKSRGLLGRALSYEVSVRRPLALARLAGRDAGYLDGTGAVFAAPAGLFDIAGPVVEAAGADRDQLQGLASVLTEAAKPGALDAPLQRMTFLSAQDGWKAELADGTVLLWGDLRFTRQKLARLREIMADARPRLRGPLNADLRYFEDGRVLLRPAGVR